MANKTEAQNEEKFLDNKFFGIAVLLFVTLFCLMFGASLTSSKFGTAIELLKVQGAPLFGLYLILPIAVFFDFRNQFIPPYYEKPENSSLRKRVTIYALIYIIISFAAYTVIKFEIAAIFFLFYIYSPVLLYSFFSYKNRERTIIKLDHINHTSIAHGFEQNIYFPAFIVCVTSISLGIVWGQTEYNSMASMEKVRFSLPLVLSTLNIIILLMYYIVRIPSRLVHVIIPLSLFLISYSLSHLFEFSYSKFILPIYALTYALGISETVKHVHFAGTSEFISEDLKRKSMDYYIRGLRWAAVIYPVSMFIIPAIVPEMSLLPLYLLIYCIVMSFTLISKKKIEGRTALLMCVALASGSIVLLGVSVSGYFKFNIVPGFTTENYRLVATLSLLSLFGASLSLPRFAKDAFGLQLDKFFKNIYNPTLYDTSLGAFMFLLLISMLYCGIASAIWFVTVFFGFPFDGSVPDGEGLYGFALNLLVSCVAALMLSVITLVTVIATPSLLKRFLNDARTINSLGESHLPPSGGGAPPSDPSEFIARIQIIWLVFVSGRPTLSFIAGGASMSMLLAHRPIIECVAIFFGMSVTTMVGFIVNDVFDIDKDRAAGKQRPLAKGLLKRSEALVASAVLSLVAISTTVCLSGLLVASALAAITVAVVAYSPIARAYPLLKGPYTSFLVLTPFWVSSSVALPDTAPTGLYIALFSFVLFRELSLDAVDLRGDLSAGIRTLAYYMGNDRAFPLGLFGMLLSTSFAAWYEIESSGRAFMLFALAMQAFVVVLAIHNRRAAMNFSRLTFLAGVVAIYGYA
jgi:4-hydroxybenzoate polyprenyltransferase